MGSNGAGKDVMIPGSNEAKSSEATVEIKIKTLDSQTYSLRVDKCLPVPALKEQIAIVTGVLSDQQRLICRGKVLKDDQLLSAYHVEDGHTLHLVVRQPVPPVSESFPDNPATDPASSTGQAQGNQAGPSVVVGTFNISDQGEGVFPDFSRIVSAVLGSFGVTNAVSGSEAVDLHENSSEWLSRTPGLGDLRNFSRQQADGAATRGQSNSHNVAFHLPTDVPLEALQPPVIPDSLTTLSQYLIRMSQEFSGNVRDRSSNSQALFTHGSDGQDSNVVSHSATGQGGLPTPASLAEVLHSTRQLLMEQVGECLMQLKRQLEDQANVTDSLARTRIQSNALRSGALLQNLGAFLLELARTTMTLRMGQAPADAVVNAGPAVFISTSGPNPIMVQPLPFQPGTSFGAVPMGNAQPGLGLSVGPGFRPRNIDIRIRTGSLMSSAAVNQRVPTSGEPLGQTASEGAGSGNISHQAGTRSSSIRESEVPVVPISTLVATAPLGRAPSDLPRSSMGILYPVLGRPQHVDSENSNSTTGQASNGSRPRSVETGGQPDTDSAVRQQNAAVPGMDGATHSHFGIQHGQSVPTEAHGGLDQLLRNFFPLDQSNGSDYIFQEMGTNSASGNVETAQEAPIVGDEGIFLANLLHQIIPIVSQNMNRTDNSSPHGADIEDSTTQRSSTVQENMDRGTSSQQPGSGPSSPSSKRQKRE